MSPARSVRTRLVRGIAFSRRTPRSELWWFVLAVLPPSILAVVSDTAILGPSIRNELVTSFVPGQGSARGSRRAVT